MFKTLACLAGAMMGTSALLGWMDPSPPSTAVAIPAEQVALLANALVGDGVETGAVGWQEVKITAGSLLEVGGQFLAASAEQADYHFYVGVDGVPRRGSRWTRQEGCDTYSCTVRIQVARRAAGQPMSRSQWLAVRAIVSSLDEVVAANGPPLVVHLDDEWAETYGLSPEAMVEVTPIGGETE